MSEYDEGMVIEISDSDETVIEVSSDSDSQDNSTESASEELMFLDLTCHEIVEDKQHNAPNATAGELATISEQFLKQLDIENDDKVLNFSNVTIRKRKNKILNTINQEPVKKDQTDKPIEYLSLKSIQYMRAPNRLMTTPQTTPGEATKSFLESLSDKVPDEFAHPESLKFRRNFKKHRNALVTKLMTLYNEHIFQNKLCHIPWTWSKWIGTYAGCCHYSKRNLEHLPSISLNEIFVTSADRLRDILLHELCHAAVLTINKQVDGHGELWQSWGHLAKNAFPELPLIQQYHCYDMPYKYKYKCTICWGSSLSNSKLKTGNIFCALCHGPVELFRIKIKDGRRVTVSLRKPGSFALFVKENYRLVKTPDITHAGVMKALSEKYSKLTVSQKQMYRKSFGILK